MPFLCAGRWELLLRYAAFVMKLMCPACPSSCETRRATAVLVRHPYGGGPTLPSTIFPAPQNSPQLTDYLPSSPIVSPII